MRCSAEVIQDHAYSLFRNEFQTQALAFIDNAILGDHLHCTGSRLLLHSPLTICVCVRLQARQTAYERLSDVNVRKQHWTSAMSRCPSCLSSRVFVCSCLS